MSQPDLRSAARVAYDRMADEAAWPDQQALRLHLALLVLPGAAVFTALREDGRTTEEAVAAVTRAMLSVARVPSQAYRVLMRSERARHVYMRYLEPAVGGIFPSPGWEITWVERSPHRIAFDVTRCFTLDTLRGLDAAPVAPAYCAVDGAVNASLSPRLQWSRTGTLATGAPRCDFCFELVQPKRMPAQPRP